jgi:cytochrome P450 family 6
MGVEFVGSDVSGGIYKILSKGLLQHEVDRKIYNHVKKLEKPYVGVAEFSKPILFVTDLDLARHIFVKDFDVFMNRREFAAMEATDPMFYKMIFFMEGEPWKELRGKMSPTFTTGTHVDYRMEFCTYMANNLST